MGGGTGAASVEVPNVVGETQAQGTSDLEGAGFVVAVETAHSNGVPAGSIISQDPAGGALAAAGSTVTITVSLGDNAQPSGGYLFQNLYAAEQQLRRRERKRRQELEEETERIESQVDREIARTERAIERNEQREAELDRLRAISAELTAAQAQEAYGERVAAALERAVRQGNRAALEALDRQLQSANDELEAHLRAVRLFLMEDD
jgi:hypothetical protein